MQNSVLITGCNGAIGSALVAAFKEENWNVIGVDLHEGASASVADSFIRADLKELCEDEKARNKLAKDVRRALNRGALHALVNNAAVQRLGRLDALPAGDILDSFKINAAAPMILTKIFAAELRQAKGAVVNIGSVHAQATKPGFSAYAASKAALHGATRALAVDLGPEIRVNTLAPAATNTPMLRAGFEGKDDKLAELESMHPICRLASPEEIARLALFLASPEAAFVTGATFYADGGILSRLHDPD